MDFIVIFLAKYLLYAVILAAVLFFLKIGLKKKINFIILAIPSFILSYLIAKILNRFIYDPRPFAVKHFKPLIDHVADNGFPSDHTLLAATIAAIVFVYNKKLGIILLVLAGVVGFSRVIAGVHHPIDIIASILIAIFVTLLVRSILKNSLMDLKTPQQR